MKDIILYDLITFKLKINEKIKIMIIKFFKSLNLT